MSALNSFGGFKLTQHGPTPYITHSMGAITQSEALTHTTMTANIDANDQGVDAINEEHAYEIAKTDKLTDAVTAANVLNAANETPPAGSVQLTTVKTALLAELAVVTPEAPDEVSQELVEAHTNKSAALLDGIIASEARIEATHLKIDGSVAMTGALAMGGFAITGAAAATSSTATPTQVATVAYVEGRFNQLVDALNNFTAATIAASGLTTFTAMPALP